jgi:hypothetical protein
MASITDDLRERGDGQRSREAKSLDEPNEDGHDDDTAERGPIERHADCETAPTLPPGAARC